MPKFISDSEMAKLETSASPKVISDSEMSALESQNQVLPDSTSAGVEVNPSWVDKLKMESRELSRRENYPKIPPTTREKLQAIFLGTGPAANKMLVQGTPPLVGLGAAGAMQIPSRLGRFLAGGAKEGTIASELPQALQKTADFLGKTAFRRGLTSGGVTYAQTGDPTSAGIAGILGAASKPIESMARRGRVQTAIKTPTARHEMTGKATHEARLGINRKIDAEMLALSEELKDKRVIADLNRFKGISKDIDEMIDTSGTQMLDESGKPLVDASVLQAIKQRADQLAKWDKRVPPTPEQLRASAAANEARDIISTASPRAAEINKRLSGSPGFPGLLDVKKTMPNPYKAGVETATEFVTSRKPSNEVAKEIAFKETGVDLPTLGKEIKSAERLQFNLGDLLPFNWPRAIVKAGGRLFNQGAQIAEPGVTAGSQVLLREAMRKKEK